MPTQAKRTSRTISGATWARRAGHQQVALTLEPAEIDTLDQLASRVGRLSKAEFCRRLVRSAIRNTITDKDLERLRFILGIPSKRP